MMTNTRFDPHLYPQLAEEYKGIAWAEARSPTAVVHRATNVGLRKLSTKLRKSASVLIYVVHFGLVLAHHPARTL